MMVSFIIFLFCGLPVAFAMAISGTLVLLGLENVNLILVLQRAFTVLIVFLCSQYLFLFTGELMNTGGITRRIIRFANAILGGIRGSLAHVNILASIIMAGFSGSATADAVAIGNILIPNMI
jgi:C4-dicarboxylate transporter DctM subunit